MINGNESEDDDFKPRRASRFKRSQQGTSSESPSSERKAKKTSQAAENEKDDSTSTCKTRSKAKNSNKDPVGTIQVKKDSELVDEARITPRKAKKRASCSSNFCPICQVPLDILKISAATHTSTCSVAEGGKECPDGSLCLNGNLFHYRDFTHEKLAAFRVSEEYIEPDIIFTPQKAKPKHTPLRNSSGKKRLSKSPIVSPPTKIPKKAPEMRKSSSSDRKSKKLFSENHCNVELKDHGKQHIEEPQSISPSNEGPEEACLQNSEDVPLDQSSLWCSDLILEPSQTHSTIPHLEIKDEPNLEAAASNADLFIHYDSSLMENQQNLTTNQVTCPESCKLVSESGELRANCSIVLKSTGLNTKEAMAQSPLSINLAVNSTGWEALGIKGKSTTSVHKVDVSLCQCSHSISIECFVNNSYASRDIKFNPLEEHEDKFFSTMCDMGLKNHQSAQALPTDAFERRRLLLSNCQQITITPSDENLGERCYEDVQSREINAALDQPFHSEETSSRGSCEQSGRVLDAFALLKSATSKRSNSSGSSLSAPTPVPMVVSKTTGSSWTLVPGDRNYNAATKKVPAYKRIPDTPFVVDAFNYGVIGGVKVYFLSHFHSDHFMGLKKSFKLPIFCSQITANLVHLQLRVEKQYLHILKIGEPRVVCGVEVEVFDANHCPGAIMFLFRLLDGRVFLHVGDFRAHPSMEELPQLRQVDKLYLDTTYCDPAYDFPYQEDVVDKVIETVKGHLSKNKSTLIVCGTYTIGKEKVFIGIAEALNFKIWCSAEKRKIYQCLENKTLSTRLTSDPLAAQVHVLAMRDITSEILHKHLAKYSKHFSHIVGFKPTGWTTSKSMNGRSSDFQKSSIGKVTIYGVPYSEHSSFSELRRFVRFIKPQDIQVTVNVSKSAEYKKLFMKWLSSNNDTNGQSKVLQYFQKKSTNQVL